ncbi:MAG: Methylmalonyl-CoA mutase, large subunit, partial [Frankiales bacterium]|nr:Methylmalonyl-CoA mutase, large subunit [Frankiales bacterium]
MTAPASTKPALHVPVNPVRFVTAASLFDGHDAAINIMRRVLQAQGCEVVHLGHDRSVEEIVTAAIQEDAQGVAISSYQGGHVEYFSYLVERLAERGASHVQVFGGGGGVIVREEIDLLASRGVKIFAPEDGQRLGLAGMINELVKACDVDLAATPAALEGVVSGDAAALARLVTQLEAGHELPASLPSGRTVPVLGITGTGGSGKSSLTDELLRRLRLDNEDKLRVAVLAVDPTRRRGGGALLGDRIRMNALDASDPGKLFFRSLATRGAGGEVPTCLPQVITACKAAGYDLVIVETPGIGQGDAGIVEHSDVSLYVMTPEYGAASQLEKIDMLDFADVVAVNKFERRGADDARRDVARQVVRNREAFGQSWEDMPVFGTSAARFDDDGVTALYQHLKGLLADKGLPVGEGVLPVVTGKTSTGLGSVVPSDRARYLSDISATVRAHHAETRRQADAARRVQHLRTAAELGADVADLLAQAEAQVHPDTRTALEAWEGVVEEYSGDELVYTVRGNDIHTPLTRETLSGSRVRRVALPKTQDAGELVRFLREENVPGAYPYTAGVFPFKRAGEAPARMFAGEGDAFRTNRRFQLLSAGNPATRLSTAFDSVTLYGRDPEVRPDVYGKVGTSGVSIATLDDMKELYKGFDLCSPTTSVSMTINGPAPTILAMFLNTVIDQELEKDPDGDPAEVRARALSTVRGTVQADILKEDQGQNT